MQQPSLNEQRIKELENDGYARLDYTQRIEEPDEFDEPCPKCKSMWVSFVILQKTVDEYGSYKHIEFGKCKHCGYEWENK